MWFFWRTPNGLPQIYEDTAVGRRIADIVVADTDEPAAADKAASAVGVAVSLAGGGADNFRLESGSGGGWGLVLAKPVDR